jgi:hypothetical protein
MFDSIDISVAMRREELEVRWKIVNAPKPLTGRIQAAPSKTGNLQSLQTRSRAMEYLH